MVYRARLAAPTEDVLDATFAALAHPARRNVLRHILGTDRPLSMCDLATTTGMSPQLLNKHASALERAGLISRVPHGRERQVYAHLEVLASARQWIEEMSTFWAVQLDSLEEYVAGMTEPDSHPPKE